MKSLITGLSFLLLMTFSSTSFGQGKTSEQWNNLLNKAELANYFAGIFNQMGFVIEETSERFTVVHQGDHFTIKDGIIKDSVDYVVKLKLQNIQNMLKHGDDSKIDEQESFKIMSVLFTPLTRASLTSPVLSKPILRRISGIENHIHINLISPEGKDTVSHTLIYLNEKWLVVPGVHGEAKRIFYLTPKDAVDYQRKVFIALNQNNAKAWRKFKKWYIPWREDVSVTL